MVRHPEPLANDGLTLDTERLRGSTALLPNNAPTSDVTTTTLTRTTPRQSQDSWRLGVRVHPCARRRSKGSRNLVAHTRLVHFSQHRPP